MADKPNIEDYYFDHVVTFLYPQGDKREERQVAIGNHVQGKGSAKFEIPDFWLGAMQEAFLKGKQAGKREIREALGIVER